MLRHLFVWVSQSNALHAFVTRNRFAGRAARRFVAGETLDEAMAVAADLNGRGLEVTLDYLGEHTTNPEEAGASAEMYLRTIGAIRERGVRATSRSR